MAITERDIFAPETTKTIDDLMHSLKDEPNLLLKGRTEKAYIELPNGDVKDFEIAVRGGPRILGHEAPSKIAPYRGSRPNSGAPEITREELKAIISRGIGRTSIQYGDKGLGRDFDKRVDEFLAERARDGCVFCYPNVELKTPTPRRLHEGLEMVDGNNVVSVPNISPLARDHYVTVPDTHVTDLSQFSELGLANLFRSAYQMALFYRDEKLAIGVHTVANIGRPAGGSIAHIHTHSVPIMTLESFFDESERPSIIRDLNGDGKPLMERYMQAIRKSPIFIFENEQVLIYAAWAPRYPHHIEAIFKNPKGGNSGNVLDFDPYDLEIAGRSLTGVAHAQKDLGVTSLNLVLHQSSFVREPHGFMMQAEFMPRNGFVRGAFEEARKFYAVTTMPETTATKIREHYRPK